jgi:myo-inositol-1(or 4)-monophosphatase
MPKHDLSTYLEFARRTALEAGQITMRYFQRDVAPDTKLDGSPVTIADRESEQYIRRAIQAAFPGHAILGEEYGSTPVGEAGARWIIDPIDGTQSFIHGVPLYSVLIGLELDGQMEVGVACFPALNEIISAASGLGCWWNGAPARVSTVTRLEDAALAFTDIHNFNRYGGAEAFHRLAGRVRYRAGWGDAYGYLLAATGRIEIMIDPIMAVWDKGPFPAIFREAGGFFGDWDGSTGIQEGRGLGTSQALLPEVLRILNEPLD